MSDGIDIPSGACFEFNEPRELLFENGKDQDNISLQYEMEEKS
jgi:hypothetical protein